MTSAKLITRRDSDDLTLIVNVQNDVSYLIKLANWDTLLGIWDKLVTAIAEETIGSMDISIDGSKYRWLEPVW